MVLEIRMVVNIGRGIVTRNMHEWCFWAPCNAVILDLGASYTDVFSLLKLLGCTFMIWALPGNVLHCNSLLIWHINMPYSYALVQSSSLALKSQSSYHGENQQY